MVFKLLIVAEKPSVARAIVRAFSITKKLKFKRRKGSARYNLISEAEIKDTIDFNLDRERQLGPGDHIIVTSVTGHIMNFDYKPPYDKKTDWSLSNPLDLVKLQPEQIAVNKRLSQQIIDLGTEADAISIATDWDSHGEAIGGDIAKLSSSKGQKPVGRMRFTSTAPHSIIRSFENQVALDVKLVQSVNSLRIQDLRMGASITRYLTVGVQKKDKALRHLISYGPCQSSVLWIIASRYKERNAFVPVPYWDIIADHKHSLSNVPFTFKLKKGRIDDENTADKLYNSLKDAKSGVIESSEVVEEVIPRPHPLDTDSLESEGSWLFNRSPKKIADVAEKLYNNGFITYPRTESSYYLQKDLTNQVEKFKEHEIYGSIVSEILTGETAKNPSKGRFTKEHEPIRPVKPVTEEELEKSLKLPEYDAKLAWKIYDYVVRRFLATVDKEGKANVKNITLVVKGEEFEGKSKIVAEEGFLRFYKFKKIEEKPFPDYDAGKTIDITVQSKSLETQPPYLWTESHLIREMARLGIGTDATRSSHIATVMYRRYVKKAPGSRGLIPTQIGSTLFETLIENASRLIHPDIRKTVEEWTKKVRLDEITPEEVDSKVIELTENGIKSLEKQASTIFSDLSQSIREFTGEGTPLETCPECGSNMVLRSSARAKRYLACGNEDCEMTYVLPRKGKLTAIKGTCMICKIMKPIRVGQGTRSWFFCPKCWIERTTGEKKEPFFCSTCKEECKYAGDKTMTRLIELLPDSIDKFPVGKGIEIISGKVLVNTGKWKKAVVLVKVGNRKQLRLYGWQKNKEGEFKVRQKFNVSEEYSSALASVLEGFFKLEKTDDKKEDKKDKQ